MRAFIKNFMSEIYKINHSKLLWIHVIIPALVIGVFAIYYKYSAWDEFDKISAYIQVLALSFPFLIGLITVISCEMEEQAGNFQFLLINQSKTRAHISKLIALLFYGLTATIFAVVGFGIIFSLQGNHILKILIYFQLALIILVSTLPIYLIHYLIAYKIGKSAGIITGIVGSLLSALLLTGLGDGIWNILPWGTLVRFCSIFLESNKMQVSIFQYPLVFKAVINLIITSTVLMIVLVIWAKKWDGNDSLGDK